MYPLLYKYCKFTEKNHDLNNLKNDTLFFNSPTGYNDPYEGVMVATPKLRMLELFYSACLVKQSHIQNAVLMF